MLYDMRVGLGSHWPTDSMLLFFSRGIDTLDLDPTVELQIAINVPGSVFDRAMNERERHRVILLNGHGLVVDIFERTDCNCNFVALPLDS